MYFASIDFNTLNNVNNFLKERGYNASLHQIGGCSCCGVFLKIEDEEKRTEVVNLINDFLKNKYVYIEAEDNDKSYYQVLSLFDKK